MARTGRVMLPQLPEGFKAAVESYVVDNRVEITTEDVLQLYQTSALIYSAANYRANNLALVDFKIVDQKDEEVPQSELIVAAFRRNFSEIMRRSELSICFWGVNLLLKVRNKKQQVESFRWLNPTIWTADTDPEYGLKGFNIVSNDRDKSPVDYVHLRDSVYVHTVDFNDDFDGVSPAEVAFLYAGMDVEIAHTSLSFFKNMAIPAAIVQPAQEQITPPDEEERNTIVDFLSRIVKGAKNFGRTIVTPTRWEWQQLQTSFDQLGMPGLAEQARNAVFMAFQVPIELVYPSASGYAQALEARRAWIQTWLVPQAQWYASAFTEQVLRSINPRWKIVPVFDSMPGMKEALDVLTSNVIAQLQAGLIDIYSAQKKLGYDPDERLKDFYVVENIPVPVMHLQQWWNKDAYLQSHAEDYGPTDETAGAGEEEFGGGGEEFGAETETGTEEFGAETETGAGEFGAEAAPEEAVPEEEAASGPKFRFATTTTSSGAPRAVQEILGSRTPAVFPKRPTPLVRETGQTRTVTPLYTQPARMLTTDEWEELKRWRRFSAKSRKREFSSSIIPSDTYLFSRLVSTIEADDQKKWDRIKSHWARESTEYSRNLSTHALKYLERVASGKYRKIQDAASDLAKAGMDYGDATKLIISLESLSSKSSPDAIVSSGLAMILKWERELL